MGQKMMWVGEFIGARASRVWSNIGLGSANMLMPNQSAPFAFALAGLKPWYKEINNRIHARRFAIMPTKKPLDTVPAIVTF